MPPQLPNIEPATLVQGDTWAWELQLPDYDPASWSLTYALRSAAGKLDITATADGVSFKVQVPAADTAALAPGDYTFDGYVTNSSTSERYRVRHGVVTVQPDLAAQTAAYDARSFNQKMLDAIRAVLQGQATKAVAEYRIQGRELKYLSPADLVKWESYYASKVRAEKGLGQGRKLGVAFVRP